MTLSPELLLASIIQAEIDCDSQAAQLWADAMQDKIQHYVSQGYIETMGELSSFVVDFLADYKEG